MEACYCLLEGGRVHTLMTAVFQKLLLDWMAYWGFKIDMVACNSKCLLGSQIEGLFNKLE